MGKCLIRGCGKETDKFRFSEKETPIGFVCDDHWITEVRKLWEKEKIIIPTKKIRQELERKLRVESWRGLARDKPDRKIKCAAYEYQGSLYMVKRDPTLGNILVGYPISLTGTIDFETEVIPETARIEPYAVKDLQRIAKMLSCKLY